MYARGRTLRNRSSPRHSRLLRHRRRDPRPRRLGSRSWVRTRRSRPPGCTANPLRSSLRTRRSRLGWSRRSRRPQPCRMPAAPHRRPAHTSSACSRTCWAPHRRRSFSSPCRSRNPAPRRSRRRPFHTRTPARHTPSARIRPSRRRPRRCRPSRPRPSRPRPSRPCRPHRGRRPRRLRRPGRRRPRGCCWSYSPRQGRARARPRPNLFAAKVA